MFSSSAALAASLASSTAEMLLIVRLSMAESAAVLSLIHIYLFVTNTVRLKKGIEMGCANSILIKPNQIGTLSETLEAVKMAHRYGYTAIALSLIHI